MMQNVTSNTWETIMSVVSFLASAASLVLSVIAIWLSFKFYRMSQDSSVRIEQANRAIEGSLQKLEEVFQLQYSDTFSILRETFSDFRKRLLVSAHSEDHATDPVIERKTQAKLENIKAEIRSDLSNVVEDATKTSSPGVNDDLEMVINKAITKSRQVDKEVRDETIRTLIADHLRNTLAEHGRWRVSAIFEYLKDRFTLAEIARALFALQEEGIVKFTAPVENWYEIAQESAIVEVRIAQEGNNHSN